MTFKVFLLRILISLLLCAFSFSAPLGGIVLGGKNTGVSTQIASSNFSATSNYSHISNYSRSVPTFYVTANYSSGVSINGVISANEFIGNGSGLNNIQWSNIMGAPQSIVTVGMIIGTSNSAQVANVAISLKQDVTMIDSSATLSQKDSLVLVNASYPLDITLPDALSMSGQSLTIKKTDLTLNWVNVRAKEGQTVEEYSNTPLMAPGDSITLFSDGTAKWRVVYRR